MDICDSTNVFTTKYDIPGRLRVKTTINHQVESPLSEKNIDPCDQQYLMRFSPCDMLGENGTLTGTPCITQLPAGPRILGVLAP